MGREISLFSDYHQNENVTTNYCGLVLKLLYEESPKKFQELLASLVNQEASLIVGPSFTQQQKAKKSSPDLSIVQQSFSIFFETKLNDWFYEEQIASHIQGFNEHTDIKILILLSNFDTTTGEKRFYDAEKEAKIKGIILQLLSFEDLVGALEQVCTSENMKGILDEFKIYLDRNELLPKWKGLLDVVNRSGSIDEINQGFYICPDSGGAYYHRRARYFGPYSQKKVESIYDIAAIIVIDTNLSEGIIKWKNLNYSDSELISKAKDIIQLSEGRINENKQVPLQVFLLVNKAETNFIKDSSGGMFQSKKYFWDIANDCNSSSELAIKLKDLNWSDFA